MNGINLHNLRRDIEASDHIPRHLALMLLDEVERSQERLIERDLPVRERIERYLSRTATNTNEGLTVKATHDDIAAAVGSVRESVTKILNDMKREGLIHTRYGRVVLVRPDLLEAA